MKLDFTKGIHTATKPNNTPPGYYRDAMNMRTSGNAKKTDEGNRLTTVPQNFIEHGSCSIGRQIIFLGTINGNSVIGSLEDNVWTVEVPARQQDVLGINEPVQVEGKKNWAGERVIYFSTTNGSRRINLDVEMPTDDEEFDKVTSLFLEYDLPKVTYLGEDNTGTLDSGVYQLAARLVTDSLATTPFGIATGIIPVSVNTLDGPRQNYQGAEPQEPTSKALSLQINNVDTAFKYIQLGVLTYVGLTNTPKITGTVLVAINGQSSINFTYRGAADDNEDLTINEFIASGVSYSTGSFIAQKDDTLLIGAPQESELPDIDWFRVARNITSKFIIKRIPFEENLSFVGQSYTSNDDVDDEMGIIETSENYIGSTYVNQGYAHPVTCELYKGYRRNEVYALTLTPVFTSGVYGPTIHIPANGDTADPTVGADATNATADPNDGGTLGTYISEEEYPDDRYGADWIGAGLKLHKMPDADIQPIIEGSVESSNCFIRVLGLKLENIVLQPEEQEQYGDRIAGYIIGRVDRRGNETQLAQGIVRPNTVLDYETDSNANIRTTRIGDGYMAWQIDPTGDNNLNALAENVDLQDFTFVAPDIIHNTYSPQQATYIKQFASYRCDPYAMDSEFLRTRLPSKDEYSRHRAFFNNIVGYSSSNTSLDRREVELDGTYVDIAPHGVPNAPQSRGGKVEVAHIRGSKVMTLCSTNGCIWYGTANGVNIQFHRPVNAWYFSEMRSVSDSDRDRLDFTEGFGFRGDFVVHTLTRRNTKQYGALDQMTSMFVHYEDFIGFTGTVECFNGDTFVNKYGLTLSDEGPFPFNKSDDSSSPEKVGYLKPINANGIVYFWLESDNNYAYRHFIPSTNYSEANVEGSSGTVPFYPAYKQLMNHEPPFGLLTMSAENWQRPGYCKTYNTQFSTQPTAKPYVNTPPEDLERKSALQNRVIYSSQAVQGEKADGYQIFLANNYYDIPQHLGELTDLYVFRELYASTAQVQWKLFYNTLATQATSAGEVVLGTGGAFNRPAVPMHTVEGGYGGNTHWLHGINTIWGRIFVDKIQGKMFMMRENLAVMSQDLDEDYRTYIRSRTDDEIRVGSEPLRERVFIQIGSDNWSYNLERQIFVSRHSWSAQFYTTHGPDLFVNKTDLQFANGIYQHSEGKDGEYFLELHPASITLSVNPENSVSKEFKNIELQTKVETDEGLNRPFDTWSYIQAWNEERNSGVNEIEYQANAFTPIEPMKVLSSKVKDSHRMIIPRDIVVDPNVDIFAISNHAQQVGDTVLAKWLPRMRGTYIELKLTYDNIQGPLYFYNATVGLSENIR